MKGFIKDNKFHPITESKGVRKSRDQNVKQEGVKIRKQRTVSKNHITASSKVTGKEIFFKDAEDDVVPYEFVWNGEIFYKNGFEKDVLKAFGAKQVSDKKIGELKKRKKFDGTNDEFLQDLRSGSTLAGDNWLDENLNWGELVFNFEEENEEEYLMIDNFDERKLYDVTGIGEEGGFVEMDKFLRPQVDFLFKVNGTEFSVDYTGQNDFEINFGFGGASKEDLQKVKDFLEEKVFEERERFTREKGVERR